MSNQTIRPAIDAALASGAAPVTDRGARMDLAQRISDYAVGLDISPALSGRLTPEYMYEHMGGLDGPEPDDVERLRGVEAYNVVFGGDSAEFVVNRRAVFVDNQGWEGYQQSKDAELVGAALRKWFKENVFMKDRVKGADSGAIDRLLESHLKNPFRIGECLKYGMLHRCFEFPESLHGTGGKKPTFIEMHARLLNVRYSGGEYPYFHIWKHEELRFQMLAITYSDERYLTVHMPGYC